MRVAGATFGALLGLGLMVAAGAVADSTAPPAKDGAELSAISPQARAAVASVLDARPHLARGDRDGRELAEALERARSLIEAVAGAPEADTAHLRDLVEEGAAIDAPLDRLRARTDLAADVQIQVASVDAKCQALLGRIAEIAVAATPEERRTLALATLQELRAAGLRGPADLRQPIRPTLWDLGSRR